MIHLQIAANGLVLGGLYACIAVGFSLVWGVLNVINILHGSFIVLGSYIAYFGYVHLGIHPFVSIVIAGSVLYALGYGLQAGIINRVVAAPVLITLTLTFGLDLIFNNALILAFTANYRQVVLEHPLGTVNVAGVFIPLDRAFAMALALLLTFGLYVALRASRLGRAIVAVRFDREAAALMGVDVMRTYAITFAIGAFMAGAAGSLLSVVFPIAPITGHLFLGKAFVICVLGGIGSVSGAAIGGIALGLLESFSASIVGPELALTVAFGALIALLAFRPQGIMGREDMH
jgi:branched-chain amino acid transport system permease protein